VFHNKRSSAVQVHWINYQGRRELFEKVAPGRQEVVDTYVTHPWVVTDETGRCLGFYMPERARRRVEIE